MTSETALKRLALLVSVCATIVAAGIWIGHAEEQIEKVPDLEKAVINIEKILEKQKGREEGREEGKREAIEQLCRDEKLPADYCQ